MNPVPTPLRENYTLSIQPGWNGVNVLELPKGQRPKATDVSPWYGIYYVSLQEGNEKEAHERLLLVRSLPVVELPLDDDLVLPAARFKGRWKVSVADAWIAATAAVRDLTLIHKDPEFERLKEGVALLALPYKPKKRR